MGPLRSNIRWVRDLFIDFFMQMAIFMKLGLFMVMVTVTIL